MCAEALVSPSSSDRRTGLSACGLIFLFNAFIALRLFHSDYIAQMGSIEGAFIGLARYIRDHFPDLNWMPLWYGGIPFPDSYPPLLHMLVAAVSGLCHISAGLAYHAVTAAIYSLAPVTLYWAARRLGAERVAAFIATLGYSLISPSVWLSSDMRYDVGGWFGPRRLEAMARWGEGPHITSLLLLPLALGCLHLALQRRRPAMYFVAALSMAAVALTNWIGSFALALVAAAYLLAGFSSAWKPLWMSTAGIAVWAYALAAPFVTPSTIATIRANAPIVANGYQPNYFAQALFLASVLLLAYALWKARMQPGVRFGFLFLYLTAAITLTPYWFKISLVPQAERYHLEMDLAFWLTAALLAGKTLDKGSGLRLAATVGVAVVLCAPIARYQHRRANQIGAPVAISSTAEYEVSHWLGEHMPGQRVYAPGTFTFWMPAFSDTPTLTGGFDNGIRNAYLWGVKYQIEAGDRQDVMLAWLRAFGVTTVVGGDRNSREYFHSITHPEKFAGLRELWRDGPEVIYEVPGNRKSLAYAMHPSDLVAVRPEIYDVKPLTPYLTALDDPSLPDADFRWRGASAATIHANLTPDEILSVQVTWDQGWNARVNGEKRRISQDKLGQMIIEPRCSGPCTVELTYDGGLEQQVARWLSVAALAMGILTVVLPVLRKRVKP